MAKQSTTTAKTDNKSRYGHRTGTQAAALDDLFFKGTLKNAAETTGSSIGRVKSHMYHLTKKRGLKIGEGPKGLFKIKGEGRKK
jgi:hypothetical protein